jgi:hypothetical protein
MEECPCFQYGQKIGVVGLKNQGTPKCKSICGTKKGVAEIGGVSTYLTGMAKKLIGVNRIHLPKSN